MTWRKSRLDVHRTFEEVVEEWCGWKPGKPEPTVEFQKRAIPLSEACRMAWNCSDILPGHLFNQLRDDELPMRSSTYAAAARAMLGVMRGEAG
jgi:hypothetical protein